MASEQFSLCWDNFHKNMSSGMNALLEHEDLVDVTLAIEGRLLKAHKMVLSVCSPYFKELFKSNPCQHPIVFMKDVSYIAMSDLLQFMYQGEVQVSQDNLTTFIKTAEALQIKGLTGDGNGSTDADTETVPETSATRNELRSRDTTPQESYKQMPRPKKQPLAPTTTPSPTPSSKRPRLSSNDSQSTLTPITKTEPALSTSTNADSSAVQFKVEPYDQNQSALTDDDGGENMEDMLDDSTVDGAEDYSMMEGEEPQAGTSTDGTGEGQGKLMGSVERLHLKLDYMHKELTRLTAMLSDTVKKDAMVLEDDWNSVFPILTMEQVDSLEAVLELPGKAASLMEYVKKIGGFNVTEITQRSMSRLLDYSVGARFSWLGKKGKLAFYSYRLAAVLKESILSNASLRQQDTTERDVEKCMMEWLRHCPQKSQNKADKLELIAL